MECCTCLVLERIAVESLDPTYAYGSRQTWSAMRDNTLKLLRSDNERYYYPDPGF